MTVDLSNVIEYHTVKEIAEMLNTTQKDILDELKKQRLEVKYKRRTKISQSLIPITEKRFEGKNREKLNNLIMSDAKERNWPQCEIDLRKRDIEDIDMTIGSILYEINKQEQYLRTLMNKHSRFELLIQALEDVKQTGDYCTFAEENNYGKVSEQQDIQSMLNDDIIAGYLVNRLDNNKFKIFCELIRK